ncbi:MAG: MFS transporter [Bifidobacteriaceae bacterium]|jgi:putative MFS transporter|nr:MFS transporter [Bifidobacteriaceae bacterium]
MSAPALVRNQRLDVLPFTREHTRLLIGSGIGWAMDAMDVGLISFVIVQLSAQWNLSAPAKSWIATAGFVGMALGASVGGLLADRLGRRSVFTVTLLIYGLATGASALAMGVGALIALRFLVGLGLGAELPVASTLVSEFAPPRIRGRVVVWLEAFWAVGWTVAAIVGYYVVPVGTAGWRWAFAIGAAPALYAVWVRRGLPESVRFLSSHGRHAEAEAVVERFERAAGLHDDAAHPALAAPPVAGLDAAAEPAVGKAASGTRGTTATESASTTPSRAGEKTATGRRGTASSSVQGVGALWRGGMARRTMAIWAVWFFVNFAYYGAFTWLPTILVGDGLSITKSLHYTLIITLAQLPGYACAAFSIEKIGRRSTLTVFLLGAAAAAGLFSQAGSTVAIIAAGMGLSFFNLGAWGALYAVTPEIYPTALRGTGSGWAAGFGRVASIITTLTVPTLHAATGTAFVFGLFAAVFVLAAVASWGLPEMRGASLVEE